MGKLIYGPWGAELSIEDRPLHHLRVVMFAKLRRGESFTLLWESTRDEGSGQDLLWFSPGVPVQMKFNGNQRISINRLRVDALMLTANEGMGLRIVAEPLGPWCGHPRARSPVLSIPGGNPAGPCCFDSVSRMHLRRAGA